MRNISRTQILRFSDILFSALALIFLTPILLPVCLLLRFTGEGEVFYAQARIGLDGKTFKLLKFATMLKNSPQIGTGAITVTDDPRVLPVGRFLRKTKINELPQILNILRGDMSIVGPRPLMQKQFGFYDDAAREIISSIRPGLTGVGSLVFRDEERFFYGIDNPDEIYRTKISPVKQILELWYVKNVSVSLYFKMIILTAVSVILPRYDASYFLPQKIRNQINDILG